MPSKRDPATASTGPEATGTTPSGAGGRTTGDARPGGSGLPTVLEGIVASRREHLPEIRARIAHVDPSGLPRSTRSLFDSLGGGDPAAAHTRFIMECKSSSPSLGMIREHYEPGAIARVYSRWAAGISVLCEPTRFGGDYDHLATVAASTHLPVLCKDFIVDAAQLHAARYFSADAVLLMLSVLDDEKYAELAAEAERLGLDVLTEVIGEEEVARATRLGAKIFGINHRNLHDLSIDLSRSGRLAELVPKGAVVVAESGVRDHATVQRLAGHAHAFLVGSQLTSQPDVDRAARELVFGTVKVCGLKSASAAQAARANGAVYGGLILEEASPRHVSRETAREIIAAEPELGYVAVSRSTSGWADAIDGLDVAAVQLHAPFQGSVDAETELVRAVRAELSDAGRDSVEVWRAVSMTAETGPGTAVALADVADLLVLDAGQGGTGTTFDWSAIPDAVRDRALLAGGLTPENLPAALGAQCLGLDLNSGFEYGPEAGTWAGHKDAGKLRLAGEIIRHHHD